MKVVSLSVGGPRKVEWNGETVLTSIFKAPVQRRLRVTSLNIDGDKQSDLTVHGGVEKTVYDYPSEHWVHLRTTNPIESTFATVRHRTKITKGPGSRAAGLAMAFKLIESAQDRWRAVNAPHLVALVRAGATFINGKLVERPSENAQPEAA